MTAHVSQLPLSLNPLMAEAKRRMRRRRVLAGFVAVLAAGAIAFGIELSSRGANSFGARAPTNLTIKATNGLGGSAVVFRLACHPASGTMRQPAKACAAIAAQPSLITKPKPFMCWGDSFSITIVGRMNGRAVHTQVSTCWTPQMALIRKLGLSLPRR